MIAKTEFYKTFTRPVLKCLLVAMLTYQLAYFGWVKLEQDETKDDRDGRSVILSDVMKPVTDTLV